MFLFSLRASTCLSFTAGNSGGEYQHLLTQDELPSHIHEWRQFVQGNTGWTWETNIGGDGKNCVVTRMGKYFNGAANDIGSGLTGYTTGETTYVVSLPSAKTAPTGNDIKHNNIQPYIVTYMFKRVS